MASPLKECCEIIQLVAIKLKVFLHARDVGIVLGFRSGGALNGSQSRAYNIGLINILEHIAEEADGQEKYVETPYLLYRELFFMVTSSESLQILALPSDRLFEIDYRRIHLTVLWSPLSQQPGQDHPFETPLRLMRCVPVARVTISKRCKDQILNCHNEYNEGITYAPLYDLSQNGWVVGHTSVSAMLSTRRKTTCSRRTYAKQKGPMMLMYPARADTVHELVGKGSVLPRLPCCCLTD